MVIYKCEICEKIFKQKIDFTRHKNRKFPCKKILKSEKMVINPYHNQNNLKNENINGNDNGSDFEKSKLTSNDFGAFKLQDFPKSEKSKMTSSDFEMTSSDFKMTSNDFKKVNFKKNEEKIAPFSSEIAPVSENDEKFLENLKISEKKLEFEEKKITKCEKNVKKKNFFCEYCGASFTRKNNRNYHIKMNRCKQEKLEEIKGNTEVHITNNYTQINQQNNIEINAFGKENMSKISDDVMSKVIKNPESGIPLLVERIHFNPEIPYNMNIKMTNKKDDYLNVYNGKLWECVDKQKTIHNLIVSKKDMADDYFDSKIEENTIDTFTKNSYETFTDSIDEYINGMLLNKDENEKNLIKDHYKYLYKKLFKQINLILINHQKLLKSS